MMAHELGHVKNRDTLTMTITATIAGAVSMLANFALFFGGSSRDNNNPLGFVGVLVAALVAPLAAMMVQMAVSRTREYSADRAAAEITGRPSALASALAKIHNAARQIPNPPPSAIRPWRISSSSTRSRAPGWTISSRPTPRPRTVSPRSRRWRASSAGARRHRAPPRPRRASRCPGSDGLDRPSTVRVARGAEPEVEPDAQAPGHLRRALPFATSRSTSFRPFSTGGSRSTGSSTPSPATRPGARFPSATGASPARS